LGEVQYGGDIGKPRDWDGGKAAEGNIQELNEGAENTVD
jgi:hypothetical protein